MKILSDILVKAGVVVEQNVSAANVSAAANLIGGTVWTYSAFKNNNNGNMALAFSGTTVSITTDAGNVINAFGNGNVAIGSNTNAGYKFDVNGNVRIGQSRLQSHQVFGALTVGNGSTGTDISALTVLGMGTGASTNFRVRDVNNSIDVFAVQENAYIGIGGTVFPTGNTTGFTFDASGVSSQAFNIVTRSNNTNSTFRGLVVTEGNLNGVSGGSFDSRYIEVKPLFNATGGVNYTIRGFYYNPTITNLSASTVNHIAFEATMGKVKLGDLAGSGVRMVVADANGLLSTQSFSANVNAFQEFTYTATAGQTTFAATYTVGQLLVYYNGSKLEPSEYTATDGTSVVLSPGVNAGDIIDIIAYQTGAGIGYGSLSATGPLTYNNTTGVFAIQKADSLKDGYLSSADWTTFNNKVSTATLAGYLPLTGGTLTGALNGTSATFSNPVTIGNYDGQALKLQSATSTGSSYLRFYNSANTARGYLGLFWDGTADYMVYDSGPLKMNFNSSNSFTFTGGGAATFSSSVTAGGLTVNGGGSNGLFINGNNGAVTIPTTGLSITTGYGVGYINNYGTGGSYADLYLGASKFLFSGGNVGIGTSSPSTKLTVYGGYANFTDGTVDIYSGSDGSGGLFGTISNHYQRFITNNTERMRITSGGNVGVFNTLYGINNVRSDGGYGGIDFTNTGIGYQYSAKVYTFKSGSTEYYGLTNDYGSGTSAQLSIIAKESSGGSGNIGFYTGSGTEKMRIMSDYNVRFYITPSGDTNLQWYNTTASAVQVKIWGDGNPRLNAQVGGSGGVYLSSGATSWASLSDETLKNITNPIQDAISKLATLRAVHFEWKSDENKTDNLGLIAQDIEKVFPQIVDTDKEGIKGVKYTELVPVLVKAIQEQQEQIDLLKAQLGTN